MQIDHSQLGGAPSVQGKVLSSELPLNDPASVLKEQMFDQLMSQSMNDMQKRQAEIKESFEKLNEES